MTPLKGTTFGWLRRFHATASLQSASKKLSGFDDPGEDVMMSYPSDRRLIAHDGYPKPFDGDNCSTERPFVDATESSKGDLLRAGERKYAR